ncbi:hypothetical protein ACOMHN_045674 [Nucella lapillus]
MPKTKVMRGDRVTRGGPLAQDILLQDEVKDSGRKKVRKRKEGDDMYVESDLTQKILVEARLQQLELEEEHSLSEPRATPSSGQGKGKKLLFMLKDDDDDDDDTKFDISRDEDRAAAAEGMLGRVDVDPDEERAFEMFMSKKGRRTLADIVQSKLDGKRTEIESVMSEGGGGGELTPEAVDYYTRIGDILAVYRRGKLPKALKTLPSFQEWEQCLYKTRPDKWTAASMYAATRIFSSNLPAALAQRFYALFLLPRIRDDIAEYKRLNFHLMQALNKSLFKTSAFFKGIIFPLLDAGNCTLREALVVSSVVREHSIPVLHAGAAMLGVCDRPYSGASSIFLRALLDKKYALAYSVVDGVCDHFLRFRSDDRQLHVLWHQCLLTFAQRYKGDLCQGQKQELFVIIRKHFHPEISPEIRRELESQASTRK